MDVLNHTIVTIIMLYNIREIRSFHRLDKAKLSRQQRQIINLFKAGLTRREICNKLKITKSTLSHHINKLKDKL